MATAGPNQSGTVGISNNPFGDTNWTNPTNAQGSTNGTFATVSPVSASHYLVASNFGFSIPAGNSIVGILVEVNVKASAIFAMADNSVQLMKASSRTGSDKAGGTNIDTTLAYVSYGGAADLWGTTWTVSDINNSGFGVCYAVINNSGTPTASVDDVRITVTYVAASGGPHLTQTRQAVMRAATR